MIDHFPRSCAWTAMVLFGLAGGSPAQPTRPDSGGIPLRPGMQWHVEELNDQERIVWDWSSGPPKPVAKQTDKPPEKERLLEKNSIGRNFRDRTFYPVDGAPQRTIFDNQLLLFFRESDQGFAVNTLDPEAGDVSSHEFLEGFGWVSERWLAGTLEVDGTRCRIYRAPWPVPPGDWDLDKPMRETGPEVVAVIGETDGFPRRLEEPHRVLRFIPFPTLNSAPELPVGAKVALEEDQEKAQRLRDRYRINQ